MPIVVHLLILFISIYVIIKSSDVLLGTAIGIGRRARLNDYFVGSFLIGIGTSLPELFTSVAAVYSGSPALVVPTVFGTVTANLGAGFGLGVLVLFFFVRAEDNRWYFFSRSHALSPGYLDFSQISKVTVILAALSVVLTLLLCLDGKFDRPDALLFAMLYAGFMGWEFYRSRNQDEHVASPPKRKVDPKKSPRILQNRAILEIGISAIALLSLLFPDVWQELRDIAARDIAFGCFIVGLILLFIFQIWDYHPELTRKGGPENTNVSKLHPSIAIPLLGFIIAVLYFSGVTVVGSLEKLSEDLGINSGILAASALALGTSLPDIVVALNVVRRGRHELLVGHIFQSNIFDAFLIMAVCGLITRRLPVATTGSAMISIIASVILTLPLLWILRSRKLTALGGLGLFAGLLAFLFLLYFME